MNNITALVTLGTVLLGFAGFYFNTASELSVQAKNISSIEARLKESDRQDIKTREQQTQDREALRKEVSARSEKTAEGIAALNEKTSILSTQLGSIKDELVKVGNQLSYFAPPANFVPPRIQR